MNTRDAQLRVRAMGRLPNGPEDDALLGPGCELGFRPRGFKRHDEVSRARVRAHDGRARRVQRSIHAIRVARAASERDLVRVPRMQRERAGPRRDRRSLLSHLAHDIAPRNSPDFRPIGALVCLATGLQLTTLGTLVLLTYGSTSGSTFDGWKGYTYTYVYTYSMNLYVHRSMNIDVQLRVQYMYGVQLSPCIIFPEIFYKIDN